MDVDMDDVTQLLSHADVTDDADDALKAATAVRPNARQVTWSDLEFGCQINFGLPTFSSDESITHHQRLRRFNPARIDCDQWVRAAKAAGMQLIVLNVKSEDGFCLND